MGRRVTTAWAEMPWSCSRLTRQHCRHRAQEGGLDSLPGALSQGSQQELSLAAGQASTPRARSCPQHVP